MTDKAGNSGSLNATVNERTPSSYDDRSAVEQWWYFVAMIGVYVVLGGLLTIGYQYLVWLRYSEWLPLPFYRGWLQMALPLPLGLDLPIPEPSEPAGFQKIIVWVFECPLAGVLIWTGLALSALGFWRERKAAARRHRH